MKCPACGKHELQDYAWIADGGPYKSDDHYDCANCGPVEKDYVDAVAAKLAELREAAKQEVTDDDYRPLPEDRDEG